MPICRHTMHLAAPPAVVHPLLCPVREHDWLEGWRATLLRSSSGFAEAGCVFSTPGLEGPDWLWTLAVHGPEHLRFTVHAPGSHVTLLDIRLAAEGEGARLDWAYDLVPLTPAGTSFIGAYAARFPAAMVQLERRLAHFLATGTMLRTDGSAC